MPTTPVFGFTLQAADHVEVAPDMETKFKNGLIVNATTINNRRKAVVHSSGAYNDKIAVPSNERWSPMVDAAFVSRRGRSATEIVNAQGVNCAEGFEQYNDNLDAAFATEGGVVANRFVNAVNTKAGNMSRELGRKALRMVGDKVRGVGPAVITPSVFINEAGVLSKLRVGDTWDSGVPTYVVKAGLGNQFKAALVSLLTRTGLTIIQSGYAAGIFTAQNTLIMDLLNAFRDATVVDVFKLTTAAADSYCLWQKVGSLFQLKTLAQITV